MSNELIKMLRESDLNTTVVRAIQKHIPNIGAYTEAEDSVEAAPLPHYYIDNMNKTAHELASAIVELNKLFVEKNITANSAEAYIRFLCDLAPEYMTLPTYNELSSVSKNEIAGIVEAQTSQLSLEEMRAGLVEHNYLKQKDTSLTVEQIKLQFDEIDDATIIDAYKTLLFTQFNKVIHQTEGANNG